MNMKLPEWPSYISSIAGAERSSSAVALRWSAAQPASHRRIQWVSLSLSCLVTRTDVALSFHLRLALVRAMLASRPGRDLPDVYIHVIKSCEMEHLYKTNADFRSFAKQSDISVTHLQPRKAFADKSSLLLSLVPT